MLLAAALRKRRAGKEVLRGHRRGSRLAVPIEGGHRTLSRSEADVVRSGIAEPENDVIELHSLPRAVAQQLTREGLFDDRVDPHGGLTGSVGGQVTDVFDGAERRHRQLSKE